MTEVEHGDEITYERLSVHSLIGNLPELFVKEFMAKGRTALIIEVDRTAKRGRFLQMLAREDDGIVIECGSNNYLQDPYQLSLDQALALVDLGFEPAEGLESMHPNFWHQSEGIEHSMEVCAMIAATLTNVFGLPADWLVDLIRRPIGLPLA
jgi:hypothetical protein